MAEISKGDAHKVQSEKSRQVQYLEQENLQLMVQLKGVKKKLQNEKAKNNIEGIHQKIIVLRT